MLAGRGSPVERLGETEVEDLCREAFAGRDLRHQRVLAVIPDHTRSAPLGLLFRVVCGLLEGRVRRLDFMVALGTHPPLSEESICRRVGITLEERKSRYAAIRFFNHCWDEPSELAPVGIIPAGDMERLSGGLMRDPIAVTVNRRVFDYDLLLVIGPTFPHEVAGFSGGNKYFFPGIAGGEIIDAFHWLGALITNLRIIGRKHTPVREVVDRAAALLPVERLCLSLVVQGEGLAGLYIGTPEEAFEAAADLSARLHVVVKEKPFHRVLSCAPPMYEELWTGGKCMYKLEPVVADGGELVIYAPHITRVSTVHGERIEAAGYHVRDYFLAQMDRFRHVPGGVLAHCTHVKGAGTYRDGVETPRIRVTLATGIPPGVCERLNLGYRDPRSIRMDDWTDREEEGILVAPRAGEMLYRLRGTD